MICGAQLASPPAALHITTCNADLFDADAFANVTLVHPPSTPSTNESVGEVRRESWDYIPRDSEQCFRRGGIENRNQLVQQASKNAHRHISILWLPN